MKYEFPKGFLWGAATSAHQVEGDNVNDWTGWEKEHAEELAKNAGKKWAPWQQEKFPEMFKPSNYISGRACDHYHLFEQDFDIAKELGHNAHRFSIEWSRIEPEEGKFDEDEIEHYKRVVSALKERGIEPFVTLWHWTNPLWIRDMGGWENKKTVEYFVRYVEKISSAIGSDVKFWVPLNEMGCYTTISYITGGQPPGIKNIFKARKAFLNLIKAQKESYKKLHKVLPSCMVGMSWDVTFLSSSRNRLIDRIVIWVVNAISSSYLFGKAKRAMDFVGVQYYRTQTINFKFGGKIIGLLEKEESKLPKEELNDLGWEPYPEGIMQVLEKVSKYKRPVYVTENGIADAQDTKRAKFVRDYLFWIHKAIEKGIDVRGYFYWSFLDNIEFVDMRGFWPRFGLVEVNFKTLERKIRPSALEYKKIIENNAIET